MDAVGRPILFKTTEDFLRCFGVSSLNELPAIQEETIENFKAEAQEEISYVLEDDGTAKEMEEESYG